MFADQWDALTAAGFRASACSDAVAAGVGSLRDIPAGSRVVYRGWMLKGGEYASLVRAVEGCGATTFTSPREYLLAHHLPSWYPLLADLTPEPFADPVVEGFEQPGRGAEHHQEEHGQQDPQQIPQRRGPAARATGSFVHGRA